MAKISVTKSNTTVLPDYQGSRASFTFYYDSALKSVVFLTSGESILLSKKDVGAVITELKKHYNGMML
jgi:hypothetical protein